METLEVMRVPTTLTCPSAISGHLNNDSLKLQFPSAVTSGGEQLWGAWHMLYRVAGQTADIPGFRLQPGQCCTLLDVQWSSAKHITEMAACRPHNPSKCSVWPHVQCRRMRTQALSSGVQLPTWP